MKCLKQVILTCIFIHVVMSQQPPGVPPHHQPGVVPPQQAGGHQNYQAGQQQVNQGYQQQGQVNNMQQQQPVGQGYQQQPPVGQGYQQQQPVGQGYQQPQGQANPHAHITEGTGQDTLRFKSDVHNKEHIMEHLQEVIETKPKEQMTEEELEFHYFKMHDYNGDNKLDGVEIGKALTHYHGGEDVDAQEQKSMTDQDIESVVDLVLKDDDIDGDGYVTYSEFIASQRNIRAKENERSDAPEQPHSES